MDAVTSTGTNGPLVGVNSNVSVLPAPGTVVNENGVVDVGDDGTMMGGWVAWLGDASRARARVAKLKVV